MGLGREEVRESGIQEVGWVAEEIGSGELVKTRQPLRKAVKLEMGRSRLSCLKSSGGCLISHARTARRESRTKPDIY